MFELFLQTDTMVSNLVFNMPHPLWANCFFSLLSGIGTWGAVWFIIMIGLLVWEEINDRRELLNLVIAFLISLLLVDDLLKNWVRRMRPDILIHSQAVFFFGYPSAYSFPSSHAVLAFACAYILAKKHKKWAVGYYVLASLIAFSRIYLGFHYVSDVIAGAVIGLLIGYFVLRLTSKIFLLPKAKKS